MSVALRPDVAGQYLLQVLVVDACNATVFATANVTATCAQAPVAGIVAGTGGEVLFNGTSAPTFADATHTLGWFPPHALDGSATTTINQVPTVRARVLCTAVAAAAR